MGVEDCAIAFAAAVVGNERHADASCSVFRISTQTSRVLNWLMETRRHTKHLWQKSFRLKKNQDGH